MFSWQDLDLAQPINWAHPLNRGRSAWWLALPQRYGAPTWWDLAAGLPGALAKNATGGNLPAWKTTSNPGGAGSLFFSSTGGGANGSGAKIGAVPALNFPGAMTALAWINLSSTSGTMEIAADCNSSGTSQQWTLEVNRTAGKLGVIWGGSVIGTGTTTLTTGTWYRVGVRRSGSTGAWNWQLLLNGKVDASGTTTVNPSAQQGAALGWLGMDTGLLSYQGYMNDVSFYNRALSDSEILADYWLSQEGYPDVLNFASGDVLTLGSAAPAGVLIPRPFVYRPRFEPAYFE